MSIHATAAFVVKTWDEKPYDEFEGGRKLTRASVTCAYTGDLEAEGKREYLMVYGADGNGNAIGLERVVGRIGERSGSFVIQHTGTFEGHSVKNTWFIVPGSGTGELQGLTGGGESPISGPGPYPVVLDYDLK